MCGDQTVSERDRASVSLSPDPQAGVPLLLGLTGRLLASPGGGAGGGGHCSHATFLSPHPDAGDREHAGRAGNMFFQPNGRCQCGSLC